VRYRIPLPHHDSYDVLGRCLDSSADELPNLRSSGARLIARHVSGNRDPPSGASCPCVCVATRTRAAVQRERRTRMDESKIPHHPHVHVVRPG
jgi:hypothetical protein